MKYPPNGNDQDPTTMLAIRPQLYDSKPYMAYFEPKELLFGAFEALEPP